MTTTKRVEPGGGAKERLRRVKQMAYADARAAGKTKRVARMLAQMIASLDEDGVPA